MPAKHAAMLAAFTALGFWAIFPVVTRAMFPSSFHDALSPAGLAIASILQFIGMYWFFRYKFMQ